MTIIDRIRRAADRRLADQQVANPLAHPRLLRIESYTHTIAFWTWLRAGTGRREPPSAGTVEGHERR